MSKSELVFMIRIRRDKKRLIANERKALERNMKIMKVFDIE